MSYVLKIPILTDKIPTFIAQINLRLYINRRWYGFSYVIFDESAYNCLHLLGHCNRLPCCIKAAGFLDVHCFDFSLLVSLWPETQIWEGWASWGQVMVVAQRDGKSKREDERNRHSWTPVVYYGNNKAAWEQGILASRSLKVDRKKEVQRMKEEHLLEKCPLLIITERSVRS